MAILYFLDTDLAEISFLNQEVLAKYSRTFRKSSSDTKESISNSSGAICNIVANACSLSFCFCCRAYVQARLYNVVARVSSVTVVVWLSDLL